MAKIGEFLPSEEFDEFMETEILPEVGVDTMGDSTPYTALTTRSEVPDYEMLTSATYEISDRDFKSDLEDERTDPEVSQPSSPRKKVGRKEKEITKLLALFESIRPPKGKTRCGVKKEYLRILLIRGFKRALRDVMDNVTPLKKLHRIPKGDSISKNLWAKFRKFVIKNPYFEQVAPTENGPGTEGKSKKLPKTINSEPKTFNDQYCRNFFSDSTLRYAFSLYLDVVFGHFECENLTNRFNFQAIGRSEAEKMESWGQLKEYLYHGLYRELGVKEDVA